MLCTHGAFITGNGQFFWKLCLEFHGKLSVGLLCCITGGVGWGVSICTLTLQGCVRSNAFAAVSLGRAGEAIGGNGLPERLGSSSCAVCIEIIDNGS